MFFAHASLSKLMWPMAMA